MKVIVISITGIVVVFTFLLFLYLILLLFKKIFYKKSTEKVVSDVKNTVVENDKIPDDVVVAILATLRKYKNKNLNNSRINITKRRS